MTIKGSNLYLESVGLNLGVEVADRVDWTHPMPFTQAIKEARSDEDVSVSISSLSDEEAFSPAVMRGFGLGLQVAAHERRQQHV